MDKGRQNKMLTINIPQFKFENSKTTISWHELRLFLSDNGNAHEIGKQLAEDKERPTYDGRFERILNVGRILSNRTEEPFISGRITLANDSIIAIKTSEVALLLGDHLLCCTDTINDENIGDIIVFGLLIFKDDIDNKQRIVGDFDELEELEFSGRVKGEFSLPDNLSDEHYNVLMQEIMDKFKDKRTHLYLPERCRNLDVFSLINKNGMLVSSLEHELWSPPKLPSPVNIQRVYFPITSNTPGKFIAYYSEINYKNNLDTCWLTLVSELTENDKRKNENSRVVSASSYIRTFWDRHVNYQCQCHIYLPLKDNKADNDQPSYQLSLLLLLRIVLGLTLSSKKMMFATGKCDYESFDDDGDNIKNVTGYKNKIEEISKYIGKPEDRLSKEYIIYLPDDKELNAEVIKKYQEDNKLVQNSIKLIRRLPDF